MVIDDEVNSLRPGYANMHIFFWVNIALDNGLDPDGHQAII